MLSFCVACFALHCLATAGDRPNVVYILADDMGYGDVRSYTANSPVDTPNIDQLASQGMRFTNAHSSSSVCTPTRYSLLTGQYTWRTRLKRGIVNGMSPSLIDPNRLTVAEMLQETGYATAAIGKWHLGVNWVTTDGKLPNREGTNVDYSQPFSGGPIDHGFDTYFGDDTINLPPYSFMRDDRTLGIPQPGDGGTPYIPTGGSAAGLVSPDYKLVDVMPAITREATSYIQQQANRDEPFFLYFPMTAPHVPIFPPDFLRDTSGAGPYGDFVATVDWAVGQVLQRLDDPNSDGDNSDSVMDETMIIFTSDNGAQTSRSFPESVGYLNGELLRGNKSTIYEGGHRVPLIVQWPGKTPAGVASDALVELNDFMQTMADVVNYPLPAEAAEDSTSMMSLLKGETNVGREFSVHHSVLGVFAIRQLDGPHEWKLVFSKDHGGFGGTSGVDPLNEIDDLTQLQLFDLAIDPGESTNLLSAMDSPHREKALELQGVLREFIESGRSFDKAMLGDFNRDQVLNASDIDWLSLAAKGTNSFSGFDLNHDSKIDDDDRRFWMSEIAKTVAGDSNLDGQFDSNDLIQVFKSGMYEDSVAGNAGWATGDWNGDQDFDSEDLIYVFQLGTYLAEDASSAASVPEPTGWLSLALVCFLMKHRRES